MMLVLIAAALATGNAPAAEQRVRAQRSAFNRALAAGDVRSIEPVLTDNVELVTGSDSMIVSGKAAQLALWTEDLIGLKRRSYLRNPDRIRVSPVGPMALETGHWRGFQLSAKENWASGEYAAKWRRIDGQWKIESELYMTTACNGTFCRTRQ